jgi:Holliday junction resolvasome RuvABC endonuclease subunit
MIIMGIDPGRHTGIAVLDHGKKYTGIFAEVKRHKGESLEVHANQILYTIENSVNVSAAGVKGSFPEKVIVERPEHRPGSPIRVSDILDLAYFTGLIVGKLAEYTTVETVTPMQWKGSVKKEPHNRRVEKLLSLPLGFSDHVIDAYGLALYGILRKRV